MRTNVSSETTRTPKNENFRTKLLGRDVSCVWTGAGKDHGSGLHIIPFRRSSEVRNQHLCSPGDIWSPFSRQFQWQFQWLQLIVENRPHYSESVDNLNDINDIRNCGVFAYSGIHNGFNSCKAVILKVCRTLCPTFNTTSPWLRLLTHIFNPMIFPSLMSIIRVLPHEVSYPPDSRYTLQWLVSDRFIEEPNPSDLLLHYNYGAAAIKWWGCGIEVLHN